MSRACAYCKKPTSREFCIECRMHAVEAHPGHPSPRHKAVALHLAGRYGLLPPDAIRVARYTVDIETRAYRRGRSGR